MEGNRCVFWGLRRYSDGLTVHPDFFVAWPLLGAFRCQEEGEKTRTHTFGPSGLVSDVLK